MHCILSNLVKDVSLIKTPDWGSANEISPSSFILGREVHTYVGKALVDGDAVSQSHRKFLKSLSADATYLSNEWIPFICSGARMRSGKLNSRWGYLSACNRTKKIYPHLTKIGIPVNENISQESSKAITEKEWKFFITNTWKQQFRTKLLL